MTSVDTASMTALQELLDERQRYEGWLRSLEQRRNVTAPHVYERVHSDYTLRLDRVLQRLSERSEQLSDTVHGLAARLTSLRTRESDRQDARQEAELRAAVGEYSDDEWTNLREEADLELALIAEERTAVEAELADLERIISSIHPRPSAAPAVESAPPASQQPVPSAINIRQTSASEHPSIDNFVADWSARRPAQAEPVAASPTPNPVTEPLSSGEPKRDQEKTLKCPECGAMNYATEWYCERCGGELATF